MLARPKFVNEKGSPTGIFKPPKFCRNVQRSARYSRAAAFNAASRMISGRRSEYNCANAAAETFCSDISSMSQRGVTSARSWLSDGRSHVLAVHGGGAAGAAVPAASALGLLRESSSTATKLFSTDAMQRPEPRTAEPRASTVEVGVVLSALPWR